MSEGIIPSSSSVLDSQLQPSLTTRMEQVDYNLSSLNLGSHDTIIANNYLADMLTKAVATIVGNSQGEVGIEQGSLPFSDENQRE